MIYTLNRQTFPILMSSGPTTNLWLINTVQENWNFKRLCCYRMLSCMRLVDMHTVWCRIMFGTKSSSYLCKSIHLLQRYKIKLKIEVNSMLYFNHEYCNTNYADKSVFLYKVFLKNRFYNLEFNCRTNMNNNYKWS